MQHIILIIIVKAQVFIKLHYFICYTLIIDPSLLRIFLITLMDRSNDTQNDFFSLNYLYVYTMLIIYNLYININLRSFSNT